MINPITLLIAFHLLITGGHMFIQAPAQVCAEVEAVIPRLSVISFIITPKLIYTYIVHSALQICKLQEEKNHKQPLGLMRKRWIISVSELVPILHLKESQNLFNMFSFQKLN